MCLYIHKETMKNIIRIARRLILVFLAVVASSTMFFSSPAVAAPVEFMNFTLDNYKTVLEQSDKPVMIFLLPEWDSTKIEEALREIRFGITLSFDVEKFNFALGKLKDVLPKLEEIQDKWDEEVNKEIRDETKFQYYDQLLNDQSSLFSVTHDYVDKGNVNDYIQANIWNNGRFFLPSNSKGKLETDEVKDLAGNKYSRYITEVIFQDIDYFNAENKTESVS